MSAFSHPRPQVPSRTVLAASGRLENLWLNEVGREGWFKWDSSNLSARITADTRQGVYVAPTTDTTGASGAWVRVYDGAMQAKWFGITADGTTDDAPGIQAAIDLLESIDDGGTIELAFSLAAIASTLTINKDNIKIRGKGGSYIRQGIAAMQDAAGTRLKWTGSAGGTILKFETLTNEENHSGGGMTGVMLDGNNFSAARGLHVNTWRAALFEDCAFYACSSEQVLMSVVDHALSAGPADTQRITFRDCLASTFGGSGTYLTSTAKGWRLTGGTAAHTGNTSLCDFYSCYTRMSKGVGFFLENTDDCTFTACSGGAAFDATVYGCVLNSSDQDSGTRASSARYHFFYGNSFSVHVRASQTGGTSSFGNVFASHSRTTGVPVILFETEAGGALPARGILLESGLENETPKLIVNGRTVVCESYPLSGTYTPTLTNTLNLDGSTALQCQYMRVGDVVTVSGALNANPTAAGDTQLGISLPIASNLTSVQTCCGVAANSLVAGLSAAILGDATNERAVMQWNAVDTGNRTMYFTFSYLIA